MFSNSRTASSGMMMSNLFLMILSLAISSCGNVFSQFADKTSDEALYYSVTDNVNNLNYAAAITDCSAMSAAYLARSEVANLCATAYAGNCGFTLLNTATNLETYASTPPPEKLFHWFTTQISGTTAPLVADCNSAIVLMNGIGAAAVRTADQNAFVTLLSIYTISATLNLLGDNAPDDGTLDGGFAACTSINAANSQIIGLAFWELNASITTLSANPLYSPVYTAVNALCTLLTGVAQNLCAAATPKVLNASELSGARSLILEGAAVGVNECGGGVPISGGCKCP